MLDLIIVSSYTMDRQTTTLVLGAKFWVLATPSYCLSKVHSVASVAKACVNLMPCNTNSIRGMSRAANLCCVLAVAVGNT